MPILFTIGTFIVLFLLSGLFSGAELALFSLNRAAVKKLQQQNRAGVDAVVKLKQTPHRLLVTILIGNNIVNIYAAALATELTIDMFGSRGVGVATGVVTFLILLFGEIFPKSIAQSYAGQVALLVGRPLLYLSYVLWPVVVALEEISKIMLRMLPGKHESAMGVEEEIKSLLRIGLEQGSTEAYERDFIERLFRFDDTAVSEIMVSYDNAVLVNGQAEITQIAHWLAESGYSRFPVWRGSRQNIIGMVHVKDIFRANNSDRRKNEVASVARRAVMVRNDDRLDEAFNLLRTSHSHSALVQNKTGVIVGFVTLEDILERLVGDIQDEFDRVGSTQ